MRKEDEARRRFAHQYASVRILWDHKFISENLFDELWKENQKEFYEEYIQPLVPEIRRDVEERRKERKRRKDATKKKQTKNEMNVNAKDSDSKLQRRNRQNHHSGQPLTRFSVHTPERYQLNSSSKLQ